LGVKELEMGVKEPDVSVEEPEMSVEEPEVGVVEPKVSVDEPEWAFMNQRCVLRSRTKRWVLIKEPEVHVNGQEPFMDFEEPEMAALS
jgi:hypothetical protein